MNAQLKKILVPVIAVLAGFLLGAIIMLIVGFNPIYGYEDLFASALGNPIAIGNTLQTAGPLILTALGFAVAMKVGLFNIGMSGQAVAGWITSVWVALSFPGLPPYLLIPLCVVMGMLAGALMGLIPGVLRAFLGTSEVIVTIMMNYVIMYFANWLVLSVMSKKIIQANAVNMTKQIPANASFRTSWLSALTGNSTLNIGFFMMIIALIVVAVLMSRTTLGFEINAVGLNPNASEYAGISAKRTIIVSMLMAGALSALGGVVYGMGYMQNFVTQTSTLDIGFNGMAVALLGENSPVGILFAGLLFSVLQQGAPGMAADSIPPQIMDIVTAAIIFFIAIKFVIEKLLPKVREAKKNNLNGKEV